MIYLLDTNHCSRIIGEDTAVVGAVESAGRPNIATSIIVHGELVFMAEKSGDPTHNHSLIEDFLRDIRIYYVDDQTAEAYGILKAQLIRHFGPKEKVARRKITVDRLGFHDNDLWIAATAIRYNLTLVSSDTDFTRMAEAHALTLEAWWNP